MLSYLLNYNDVNDGIFIPKYYDPDLNKSIELLEESHTLYCLGDLIDKGVVSVQTGHELGKMAYGTGSIPFVRTSDISNWEIKTIPKQGVSEEIYLQYAHKEDVKAGDILMVKDGTYLIGTNCMITSLDIPMVFQSHILKFRVIDQDTINPYLFFLCLNSPLVQKQIRNIQFTADIIDTIGSRYRKLILPIPKDIQKCENLSSRMAKAMEDRVRNKAAIKQMPVLIEKVLDSNSILAFEDFFAKPISEVTNSLVQDTTSLEFGGFSAFMMSSHKVMGNIYLPKYYDPKMRQDLLDLSDNCVLKTIQELIEEQTIAMSTGDEIGKMAYGTGDIPFVRTSDFSNWEIKADTKQGVSEKIYRQYAEKEDVRAGDILIVRDGTYLVGTSCMITNKDEKMLFCGGLIKIRVINSEMLDSFLLLGLLNSYIVKRQIRTKQFTRDVIDTLGQRIKEVIIPIPKSDEIRNQISQRISSIIQNRIEAREVVSNLSNEII